LLYVEKEIERLIAKGYLKQLVKGHAHMEQDREEPSQSTQALPKINVILKGTPVRGDTSSGKKIALKIGLDNCSSAEPIARAYHFHSRR